MLYSFRNQSLSWFLPVQNSECFRVFNPLMHTHDWLMQQGLVLLELARECASITGGLFSPNEVVGWGHV